MTHSSSLSLPRQLLVYITIFLAWVINPLRLRHKHNPLNTNPEARVFVADTQYGLLNWILIFFMTKSFNSLKDYHNRKKQLNQPESEA